jgi:hypothetical protein
VLATNSAIDYLMRMMIVVMMLLLVMVLMVATIR